MAELPVLSVLSVLPHADTDNHSHTPARTRLRPKKIVLYFLEGPRDHTECYQRIVTYFWEGQKEHQIVAGSGIVTSSPPPTPPLTVSLLSQETTSLSHPPKKTPSHLPPKKTPLSFSHNPSPTTPPLSTTPPLTQHPSPPPPRKNLHTIDMKP